MKQSLVATFRMNKTISTCLWFYVVYSPIAALLNLLLLLDPNPNPKNIGGKLKHV